MCNVKSVMCNIREKVRSFLHYTLHSPHYTKYRRGVTLIEALVTLVISAIAMFALVLPFIADRALWGSGKAQAESQRDTEMVMRAIARFARESEAYPLGVLLPGPGHGKIQFIKPDSTQMCFEGGPTFPGNPGKFYMGGNCITGGFGGGTILIDGVRSKVQEFSISPITNKLVRFRLRVSHQPIASNPNRVEDEVLETEIFLRNGS